MRAGSFGLNQWLMPDKSPGSFERPDAVANPSRTPIAADALSYVVRPLATDLPPQSPTVGGGLIENRFPMSALSVPRHLRGTRPNAWDIGKPLPGGVNIGFVDGHVQSVRLEQLWQQTWH
jgi:prepilin-type processing-associated H-X9-DG protein